MEEEAGRGGARGGPPSAGSQGLEQHSAAAFELAPARYPEDAVGRAALSIVIALSWAVLADADVQMWRCEGPRLAP